MQQEGSFVAMRIKGLAGQQIRQYLVEALLILMETKDYDHISIGEIAEKAGVNRSSYYRHFSGKEDILRFYLMTIMREYQETYRKGSDRTFHAYTRQIFDTFYAHCHDLLLIHRNGLSYLLLDVLNRCFRLKEPGRKIPAKEEFMISYHIGGIYNNLCLWMDHGMKETPAQMTDIALSFRPEGSFTLLDIKDQESQGDE